MNVKTVKFWVMKRSTREIVETVFFVTLNLSVMAGSVLLVYGAICKAVFK